MLEMLPELSPPLRDWMLILGVAAAIVTAISTFWNAFLKWRPPFKKPKKIRVDLDRSRSSKEELVLSLYNEGRIDVEVLGMALAFGHPTNHLKIRLEQESDNIIIRPGGFRHGLKYRWLSEHNPRFGLLSQMGNLYRMRLLVFTPHGLIVKEIKGTDGDWLGREVRKRLRHWKTETRFDPPNAEHDSRESVEKANQEEER